jgi:hypothetical protein
MASRNNACCSALVRSTSKLGPYGSAAHPRVGQPARLSGNVQFAAAKVGLHDLAEHGAGAHVVIDRGMAVLPD